jgi:hypothetical protein
LQRRFSSLLDECAFVERLEGSSPAARARLMSASAPHAGAWLCPLPGAIPLVWFPASVFVALLAFRLGLPVTDGAVVPARCAFCGVPGVEDVWGHHARSRTAARWPLHNAPPKPRQLGAPPRDWGVPRLDSAAGRPPSSRPGARA